MFRLSVTWLVEIVPFSVVCRPTCLLQKSVICIEKYREAEIKWSSEKKVPLPSLSAQDLSKPRSGTANNIMGIEQKWLLGSLKVGGGGSSL